MDWQQVTILVLLSISFLIQLISFLLASSIFRTYWNLPSSRILIIQLLFFFWISTILYLELTLVLPIKTPAEPELWSKIALSAMFLGFIILCYMQINSLYDRQTRLYGSIALGGFNFNMSYIIADLFMGTSFFNIKLDSNLSLTFSPTIAVFIFFSGLMYFLSFYFSMKRMQDLPSYLYSSVSASLIRTLGMIILALGTVLLVLFIVVHGSIEPVLGMIMILLVCFLSLAYVYFNYTQPFIQIGNGANPVKLLQYNLVGYYVGTSIDTGPTLHLVDREFLAKSQLSEMQIQTTIVGVMTMVGINDSFAERLSLVPIPKSPEFIALNVTFQIKNDQVADTRFRDRAPSVIGIILPALMAPLIKHLSNLQPTFSQILQEVTTISDLTSERVHNLVGKILHEILN